MEVLKIFAVGLLVVATLGVAAWYDMKIIGWIGLMVLGGLFVFAVGLAVTEIVESLRDKIYDWKRGI